MTSRFARSGRLGTGPDELSARKRDTTEMSLRMSSQADEDRPLDRCQSAAATGSKLIFSRVPVALAKRSSVRVEGRT